jgi:signal transduction histidine kinase
MFIAKGCNMNFVNFIGRRTLVLPLACVAALAMLVINEASYRQSVRTLDQLGTRSVVSRRIQDLQQAVLDAESGQRGYLLTQREELLVPYHKALQDIAGDLGFLDQHYAGESAPMAVLDKIHTLVAAKLSQLALTITSRRGAHPKSLDDIVLSKLGPDHMTAIRLLGNELLAHESQRIVAGRTELYESLQLGRVGVATLSGLSLLALYLYLRQTAALVKQQLRLKQSVQAERDRLEVEVKRRTLQLTELAHHLQTAREDERQRLARDLHDELGALLTSAKLDAARIKSRLTDSAPEAQERLAHLVGTLNRSIALGRSIIEDLRPSTLGNLGLVATLEILSREFAETAGVEVHCEMAPVRLRASAELVVYRLVQEALTNISKYAKAQHVWIVLGAQGEVVRASVRDDGVGFDTTMPHRSAYGLLGMRFRVEAEGGVLDLASSPGQGTRLTVTLPESTEAGAAA